MSERRDASVPGLADGWEASTWAGNARWRAERVLQATPLARLRWLEAALVLAHRAGALPTRRPEKLPADR
jgi:hypothetical protein